MGKGESIVHHNTTDVMGRNIKQDPISQKFK